jgi:hypothetical protein
VHPGCETSTDYFSCLGGPSAVSIKKLLGHITLNLGSYIRWDPWIM